MGKVSNVIKKIVLGNKYDSNSYVKYLLSLGCEIGSDVIIYDPTSTCIDITRPWLIKIGSHVRITKGVTILTHGYDWSVLKTLYGEVLGSSGGVTTGDNVFIGMQTTILKGVNIGNNVIIGANSLVNRDIPDNCVAGGNPCRVLMSIEEYYQKRKNAQLKEATELVVKYRERYQKEPDEKALREYFWLFSNNPSELPDIWKSVNKLCLNEEYSNEVMKRNTIDISGMSEFLNSIPWVKK